MGVPVPFARVFMLLLLALPCVWLFGRSLAHVVSRDRAVRSVLSAGLALVGWLLAVHIASLAMFSLRRGLPTGTLVAAALGVAAEILRRRARAGNGGVQQASEGGSTTATTSSQALGDRSTRPGDSPLTLAGTPLRGGAPEGRPASPWMWITATFATLLIARLALHFHFHDEVGLNGHMAFAAEMQNGIYPPRHLTFPDTLLRYHYGFDILSASLTALFHVRIDQAIDIATLSLFFLSWCLLWVLGERLVGRRAAWLVPLCALFAGGLTVTCTNPPAAFVSRVVEVCWVGKHYVNPPVTSYFFQHPWSLGIPIGVTTLLVFTSRRPHRAWARLAILALCLAALSMSQITLFAGFLPAFVVAEIRGEDELEPMRGVRMIGVVLVALLAAKAMGGFLLHPRGLPTLEFTFRYGFGDTPEETLLWNLQTFGVLLPLGAVGFFRMRRDALVFGLLAAGGVLVCNTVKYAGSEDILKFATLASMMLGVLAAGALASLWPERVALPGRSAWSRATGLLAVLLVTFSGLVFAVFTAADWPGLMPFMRATPDEPDPSDVAAITWVRSHIRRGELVYRNGAHSEAYAQWGGLPQPWIQWTVKAFGFPEERILERERLLHSKPASVERYRREGFRFMVLDDSEKDEALRAAAESWIDAGRAKHAATFEGLLVVDLAR